MAGNRRWQDITAQQLRELAQLRSTLAAAIRGLRRKLKRVDKDGRSVVAQEKERQEALAEIIRLTQVQMKIIPLEQDLLRDMEKAKQAAMRGEGAEMPPLSEAEWEMLEDVIHQRRHAGATPAAVTFPAASEEATSEVIGIDDGQQIQPDAQIGKGE